MAPSVRVVCTTGTCASWHAATVTLSPAAGVHGTTHAVLMVTGALGHAEGGGGGASVRARPLVGVLRFRAAESNGESGAAARTYRAKA